MTTSRTESTPTTTGVRPLSDQPGFITKFFFVHTGKTAKTTKEDYIKCTTRVAQLAFGAGGIFAVVSILSFLVPIPGLTDFTQALAGSPMPYGITAVAAVVVDVGGEIMIRVGGCFEDAKGPRTSVRRTQANTQNTQTTQTTQTNDGSNDAISINDDEKKDEEHTSVEGTSTTTTTPITTTTTTPITTTPITTTPITTNNNNS